MTKHEFLTTLRECLLGNVPSEVVEENVKYYREYIESSGKSETESLGELGDPHLISRTIIASFQASKGPMADFYTEQARNEYKEQSGREAENADTRGQKTFQFQFGMKWYEKVAMILLGILLVGIVLVVAVVALGIFLQFILPVLVIILIVKLLVNFSRRG